MEMLRKTMGLAMPLKLQMEKKAVMKVTIMGFTSGLVLLEPVLRIRIREPVPFYPPHPGSGSGG
jgi:hypothetical protein